MVNTVVHSRRRATCNGRRIRIVYIRLRLWGCKCAVCPSPRRVSPGSGIERIPINVAHRQLLERCVSGKRCEYHYYIISITIVLFFVGALKYRGSRKFSFFFFFFFFLTLF